MNLSKRRFLKWLIGASGTSALGITAYRLLGPGADISSAPGLSGAGGLSELAPEQILSEAPDQLEFLDEFGWTEADLEAVRLDSKKMQSPDRYAEGDVFLPSEFRQALPSALARLNRAQGYFGHGFFNIVGFKQLFETAGKTTEIGRFSIDELGLLQWLFFEDAKNFGFKGPKVSMDFLAGFTSGQVHYERQFGQFLFREKAKPLWERMRKDIGRDLILTSGARALPKQCGLFLAKLMDSQGNVSLASRSLAPPGYSFHGSGDFDVGSRHLGDENFTHLFARSDVFRRMQGLAYIELRYPAGNRFGVRFEPWHVKVGS